MTCLCMHFMHLVKERKKNKIKANYDTVNSPINEYACQLNIQTCIWFDWGSFIKRWLRFNVLSFVWARESNAFVVLQQTNFKNSSSSICTVCRAIERESVQLKLYDHDISVFSQFLHWITNRFSLAVVQSISFRVLEKWLKSSETRRRKKKVFDKFFEFYIDLEIRRLFVSISLPSRKLASVVWRHCV